MKLFRDLKIDQVLGNGNKYLKEFLEKTKDLDIVVGERIFLRNDLFTAEITDRACWIGGLFMEHTSVFKEVNEDVSSLIKYLFGTYLDIDLTKHSIFLFRNHSIPDIIK